MKILSNFPAVVMFIAFLFFQSSACGQEAESGMYSEFANPVLRKALTSFTANYREINGTEDIRKQPVYPGFTAPQMKRDIPIILETGVRGEFVDRSRNQPLTRAITAAIARMKTNDDTGNASVR